MKFLKDIELAFARTWRVNIGFLLAQVFLLPFGIFEPFPIFGLCFGAFIYAYCSILSPTPTFHPEDVRWVVNDMGELGVEIRNQVFFCYKGKSLSYDVPTHCDGDPILYRKVGKREFGETVQPLIRPPLPNSRYLTEVVYTPGLSCGDPNDPAYTWKPLPTL